MDSLGCNYNAQSEFSLFVLLQTMILTSSVHFEDCNFRKIMKSCILLFYLVFIPVFKLMCSSNDRSRNYWWTSLSMSSSPSIKCWLQRRKPSSWRSTMWWMHRYASFWSYLLIVSYCFIIQELEVMVPFEFCSLLLLHLVENSNAAWWLLSVVAFHHTC